MTQPRPQGLGPISNFEVRPTISMFTPPASRKLGSIPPEADHDPFTSPLLKRWAADQIRRVETATSEIDLWSGIVRKIST